MNADHIVPITASDTTQSDDRTRREAAATAAREQVLAAVRRCRPFEPEKGLRLKRSPA